jgi:hypothetical protein
MFDDYPTMGTCKRSGGCTSAGVWCHAHQPKAVKPQAEPRTPTIPRRQADIEAAITQAMKEFDAAKAADRVMKSGITIDIITVQGLLRCQYRQAAAVIELLKSQGRIKMNDTCNQCGNQLKPQEFITCDECKEANRIINQRLERVKDKACEDVRRERAARKGL